MDYFQIVRRDNSSAITKLNNIPDVNIRNEDGLNLLHEAIAFANDDTAFYLMSKGIDINAQDVRGLTPLHYCGVYNNPIVAEGILSQGGDIRITDKHGNTPLWSAVFNSKGNYKVVEVIVSMAEYDVSTIKNKTGRSPIDFARQINDRHLMQLICIK